MKIPVVGKLIALHIVAEQGALVTDVKLAIHDDRMCPAVLIAAVNLIKAPFFYASLPH